MKRIWWLAAGFLWPGFSGGARAAELPEWIWLEGDREGRGSAAFMTGFNAGGEIEAARLRIATDFAEVKIVVRGETVAELEGYDPNLEMDLRPFLRRGGNEIHFLAKGVPGPSAIAAEIEVVLRGGERIELRSDEKWPGELDRGVAKYGRVDARRWGLNRLAEVSPFAEYNQWKEAEAGVEEKIAGLPEGFEIERLRAAREGEDSWVSLAIDERGRLIVAREQEGLLRMTLGENGEGVRSVEVIEDTLKECRGVLCRDGEIFVNANRSKGLYRLRDPDGDGIFDEVELLQSTEKAGGHGRNDIVLGPDGGIHAIHGDSVSVPAAAPRRTVAELGAPKELGHWASTKPGGKGWEIRARGLRNPYGIDFNAEGEAFTYDADNEGDVGLPFYRPTRINHLVNGANYGWHQERGNTRSMTVWAPDSLPTTFDVGRGSPTGVKFGTGSDFPLEYREALFALDWSYGRILRVDLTARGASYYGSGEVFLEGRPLNVTDLDFGPEGAMYFVTGGRKTQSALYRVRYTGPKFKKAGPGAQALAREEFSERARERRRVLEGLRGGEEMDGVDLAWEALGEEDPWIRNAARVAVERRELKSLRSKALAWSGELNALTGLLALARAGSDADRVAAAGRVAEFDLGKAGRSEKLTAMRIYEVAGEAVGSVEGLKGRVRAQVGPWVDSVSDAVRREAVRVLAMVDAPEAVEAGMRLQAEAGEQLERLHYLEMLAEARSGWTGEKREAFFRALAHAKGFSYGDRYMEGFFSNLESNALVGLGAEREKFAAILAGGEEEVAEIPVRELVKHWKVEDFADDLEGGLGERDGDRGKAMFEAALCGRCHVAGTVGRPVGPDLTMVGRRFSRRDLLESIIEPSKVVAEVHRNVVITMKDGSVAQGRVIQNDFRNSLIHLATNPFLPGELKEIAKGEIVSTEASPVSPMPPGLLDTLTREEVLELLAWLEGIE